MFFLFLSLWPDQQQVHQDKNQSKPDEREHPAAAGFLSAGHQNGPIAKQTYSLFCRHGCSKLEQPFLSISKYSFPPTDSKAFVCSGKNRGDGGGSSHGHVWPGRSGLLKNPESRHCEERRHSCRSDVAISIHWATYSMRLPRSLRSLAMTTKGTLSTLPEDSTTTRR